VKYIMRWKSYWNVKEGDIRIKEKFLLFPKRIDNEWRWLEKAKYKQVYERYYFDFDGYYELYNLKWRNKEWIK
jgi:5'-deoxynucleotidase YfbR-like HD superfamily hydrolase